MLIYCELIVLLKCDSIDLYKCFFDEYFIDFALTLDVYFFKMGIIGNIMDFMLFLS